MPNELTVRGRRYAASLFVPLATTCRVIDIRPALAIGTPAFRCTARRTRAFHLLEKVASLWPNEYSASHIVESDGQQNAS